MSLPASTGGMAEDFLVVQMLSLVPNGLIAIQYMKKKAF